jgi:hypothetical protein
MNPLELLGKVVSVIYEMRREYYFLMIDIKIAEWTTLSKSQQTGFIHEIFHYLKFNEGPEAYYNHFFEEAAKFGILMVYPTPDGDTQPLKGYDDLPEPLKQSAHVTYYIAKTVEQFIELDELPDQIEFNYQLMEDTEDGIQVIDTEEEKAQTEEKEYNEDDPDQFILKEWFPNDPKNP